MLVYQKGKNCAHLERWKCESMTTIEGTGIPKDGPHFRYCFQVAAETARVQGGPSVVRAEPQKLGKWVSFLLYRRRNETDVWRGWYGPWRTWFPVHQKVCREKWKFKKRQTWFSLKIFSFLPKFFDVLKKLFVALKIFICLDKIIQLGKSGSFHEHFCLIKTPGFPLRSLILLWAMLVWRTS